MKRLFHTRGIFLAPLIFGIVFAAGFFLHNEPRHAYATNPDHLVFTVPPASVTVPNLFSPTIVVTIKNADGSTAVGSSDLVTLAIVSGPGTLSGTPSVNAVNGVATFGNGVYSLAAGDITIQAQDTNISSSGWPTTSTITITPAAADRMVMANVPTQVKDVPFTATVTLKDGYGNVATNNNGTQVTIARNSGSGSLTGTLTKNTVNGVATFDDLSIDTVGSNFRLSASASGVSGATSNFFDISAPPTPDHMVFSVQPPVSVDAGTLFSPAPVVVIKNPDGTTATHSSDLVRLSLASGSGSLGGTTEVAAVNGVATFDNVYATAAGDSTYQAQDDSVTAGGWPTSDTVTVNALAPYRAQPSLHVGFPVVNSLFAVDVYLVDIYGNVITTDNGRDVTLAIGSSGTDPGGGTLSGTLTKSTTNGFVQFSDLAIDAVGTNYTIVASTDGLTDGETASFNVTVPVPPDHMTFTTQPHTPNFAGDTFSAAVTIRNEDDSPATGSTDTVRLVVSSGTGTLLGTTEVAAVNGVATFDNLQYNVAENITLQAQDDNMSDSGWPTSDQVTVNPAAPDHLSITSTPTPRAGNQFSVTVVTKDAYENNFGDNDNDREISMEMTSSGTNPGGGTLSGTLNQSMSGGTVTFNDLSVDTPGQNYRICASTSGLTEGCVTFNVGIAATKLRITTAPSSLIADQTFTITAGVYDDADNLIDSDNDTPITIAKGGGVCQASFGALSGTLTQNTVDGRATFTDLSYNTAEHICLTVSAPGLADAETPLDVLHPHSLVFSVAPPSTGTAGDTFSTTVSVVDAITGDPITDATDEITLSLFDRNHHDSPDIFGTIIRSAVDGVAVFDDLSIRRAGTSLQMNADASGLNSTTADLAVSPASASKFVVSTNGPYFAGDTFTPSVQAEDAFDNVASFDGDVTLAFGQNDFGATLGGTLTQTMSGGNVSFSDISVNKAGTGYTIVASADGLTSGESNTFDVVVHPNLVFTSQPTNTVSLQTMSPVEVTLKDDDGNVLTDDNSTEVTLGFTNNAGGGSLFGSVTRTAVNGVVTFDNISINKAGSGYTLSANADTARAPATSAAFNITPGTPTSVVFSTQPTNETVNTTFTAAVSLQDDAGNIATGATNDITLTLYSNSNGATLSGTLTKSAVAGVATFDDLSIDKKDNHSFLIATPDGINTSLYSNSFAVYGVPDHLTLLDESNQIANQLFTARCDVRDSDEEIAGGATNNITISLGQNPTGATLESSDSLTETPINGSATFFIKINKIGTGYTLVCSAPGLTSSPVDSSPFNVGPGGATKVVFTSQPTTVVAGAPFSLTVAAQDSSGNSTTDSFRNITITLTNNNSNGAQLYSDGVLTNGSVTKADYNGTVTFDNLSIDTAATGYILAASGVSFFSSPAYTDPITVTAAPSGNTGGGGNSGGGGGGGSGWTSPSGVGQPNVPFPPTTPNAFLQSISAIQDQINALIQKIFGTKKIPPKITVKVVPKVIPKAVTTTTATTNFSKNLSLGAYGSSITALQKFLISQAAGPKAAELKAHGLTKNFGPLTAAALAEFQKSVGITPNGVLGPKTRAYINGVQ